MRDEAKFIVNSKGRRLAVILPVAVYEALLAELEDLRDLRFVENAEATAEGFVELSQLRRELP